MKSKLTIGMLLSALILTACGSGGSSAPSSGNSGTSNTPQSEADFPVGVCGDQRGQFLSPPIYANSESIDTVIGYEKLTTKSNVQIIYSETEAESSMSGFVATPELDAKLPTGTCAISNVQQIGDESKFNGGKMYVSNCSTSMESSTMTFTSDYSIYAKGQSPESGTALQSGKINFTCDLLQSSKLIPKH